MVIRTRGLKALVRAIGRIFLRSVYLRLINRRFVRTSVFDFKLWIDLRDRGISRTLWLFGERELDHKWILEKVVWPGARILDVGANIGACTVIFAVTGIRVISVEALAENVLFLNATVRANQLEKRT